MWRGGNPHRVGDDPDITAKLVTVIGVSVPGADSKVGHIAAAPQMADMPLSDGLVGASDLVVLPKAWRGC